MEDSKQKKIEALLSGDTGRILAALEGMPKDISIYHTEEGTGLFFASDGSHVSKAAISRNSGMLAGGSTYINAIIIHYAPGTNVQLILRQHEQE